VNIIKRNINDFSGIKNMLDFYRLLGIYDKLGHQIQSVSHIRMNDADCEKLKDFMINNIPRNKKKLRYYTTGVILDWVNLSPKSDNNVPSNEIWIDEIEKL